MDELKPCPFCGGPARISIDHEATKDSMGRKWAYTVVCGKCAASSGLHFSEDEIIKYWNRRYGDEH